MLTHLEREVSPHYFEDFIHVSPLFPGLLLVADHWSYEKGQGGMITHDIDATVGLEVHLRGFPVIQDRVASKGALSKGN